ncbi:unnamed protein product [Adineta steineri]|uniref:NHL repeat containing protein n=1 Tax=Adineta steineri TaxID=433720 RepID=A0A814AWT2_9BILA|nr:unnamed protein product [Adineta steineri]CAF0860621.1 unnamed protein product [Adineta steineri]CAF0921209.1 unnamed protein product [Adineta steineri]
MDINDTVDVDESIVVNLNPTQLQTLYEHFRKRKLIWIIVLIILIIAIIAIPTIIVTMNTEKREKTSTVQKTTVEIKTTTAARYITTERTTATAGKPVQITTTEKTATEQSLLSVIIDNNMKWKQSAITVAGGNEHGDQINQLYLPQGIHVDEDSGDIYIADSMNDRIVRWKFGADTGEIVADGKEFGPETDQLLFPTDVILDKEKTSLIICDPYNKRVIRWFLQNSQDIEILISNIVCYGLAMHSNGDLYISDQIEHQVIRWQEGETEGTVIAGGNEQGNQLNQFNNPKYIFVDEDHSVYVADNMNSRVMKWMKNATEGILVAQGKAFDENPNSIMYPIGVIVDHMGNIYVSNGESDQIMRWSPGAIEGVPVAGEKQFGSGSTQLRNPYDLSFDRHGNLYVVDSYNYRIQKFVIDRD